ncbi:amino acid ABC transporter permease [Curvivirga sp.]|uniref:amino acid ABC transporter permease n=1 Tax=Curvivirga sp. TaxID=2856848 RepID=UPI003B5BC035
MKASKSNKEQEFPYWLAAIIVIGFIFTIYIVTNELYTAIFNTLYRGALMTIFVTLVSFTLASILGLIIAVAGFSKYRLIREVVRFYTEVMRGVPVLVLLFYIAFVAAPSLVDLANWILSYPIDAGWMKKILVRDFSLTWRAIFALMLGYSAYIAEIFRAGIQSVEEGQIEAAQSLGMKRWQIFSFIIFPQAIRTILPPLGNDFIAMVKDSALVSVLGVADITQLGKVYASGTFRFFETYNMVTFMYLVLTIGLSLMLRRLEKQLSAKNKQKA